MVVTAREPALEHKSYRDLLAATARFERYRAAHPDAQLRFRIYPRKEGIDFSQLRVWLLDPEDGSRLDLAFAPDSGFTVPVLPAMRDHDAVVRTNMPDGTLAWEVEVKRAGEDEHRHLLGDLREACLLDVDFAHLGRGIKPPALYAIDAVVDNVCLVRGVSWGFYGERPVFSVHLAAGERRAIELSDRMHCALTLPLVVPLIDPCYVLRDRFYSVPLNDATWPDDTTVDLAYTDDPDADAAPAVASMPGAASAAKP